MPKKILIVLAAATALVPAGSASASSYVYSCKARNVDVLFWPKGHPAKPSVGFPNIPLPHIEIYKGPDRQYPPANYLFYADGKRRFDPSRSSCQKGSHKKVGGVKHAKHLSKTKTVSCTAPSNLTYELVGLKGGLRVIGRTAKAKIFVADIKRKKGKSRISYDSKRCKVKGPAGS